MKKKKDTSAIQPITGINRYKGRVIGVLFTAAILFFIREAVISRFGVSPHPIPIPAMIVLVIAWLFGSQYDKSVRMALTDPLTGLSNRRALLGAWQRIEKRSSGNRKLCLILIDVNDFKQVNDGFGHEVGDELLMGLAGVLKQTFGKKDVISRWGGDEFVVLSHCPDEQEAKRKIETIKERAEGMAGHAGGLSVSVGHAFYPDQGSNLHELVSKADAGMYEQKLSGKRRPMPLS